MTSKLKFEVGKKYQSKITGFIYIAVFVGVQTVVFERLTNEKGLSAETAYDLETARENFVISREPIEQEIELYFVYSDKENAAINNEEYVIDKLINKLAQTKIFDSKKAAAMHTNPIYNKIGKITKVAWEEVDEI